MNLNDELIFQFRKELDVIKNLECKNCRNASLSFNQHKYCSTYKCDRIRWVSPITVLGSSLGNYILKDSDEDENSDDL